jgi:hypothetical protein
MNPPSNTEPLASEQFRIERKLFFIDLRENARGRYLKITEDVNGRRNTLLLPAAAAAEFLTALKRLVDYEASL